MHYSLLLLTPELPRREPDDKAVQTNRAAFDDYAKALHAAGALVSAIILSPSIATTTVTVRDGEVAVGGKRRSDGDEQLMGTFVIDVHDREAAIEWAAKCPAAERGTVEVRPSVIEFTEGAWRLVTP
jgi:hypothetical protein